MPPPPRTAISVAAAVFADREHPKWCSEATAGRPIALRKAAKDAGNPAPRSFPAALALELRSREAIL
jgi:hypothetical protein